MICVWKSFSWIGSRLFLAARDAARSARVWGALAIFLFSAGPCWAQQPPEAEDDYWNVTMMGNGPIPVLWNDWADYGSAEDPNGIDFDSVEIVGQPAHGTAMIDPETSEIWYFQNSGYTGGDSVTYVFRDLWGEISNVAVVYLWVDRPPTISSFIATTNDFTVWTFSGTVDDEDPAGPWVTFGDILDGESVQVNADGTFTFSKYLGPETAGVVTAQTQDNMGLGSNTAQYVIFN
jgi:hypothetical protein